MRPFALTLSGASLIVLRAASSVCAFTPQTTNASLGGVSCHISAVSADGCWAALTTPTPLQLCDQASSDCGYAILTLENAPSQDALGAALSCPPFCAGALGGGVVPLAIGNGMFALGAEPATPVGSLPRLLPQPAAGSTSAGVYYAQACAQTGVWTDPASGACSNATDPASLRCAYGGASACEACPSGALCPGGSRLWPRVGYWAASERASTVTPCAPPDPAIKCGGWDIDSGLVQCGRPYLRASFLCGACAPGFYPTATGLASPAPSWQASGTATRPSF